MNTEIEKFKDQVLKIIRTKCDDPGAFVVQDALPFGFIVHAIRYEYKYRSYEKRNSLYFHFELPYWDSGKKFEFVITRSFGFKRFMFDAFFESSEQLIEFLPIIIEGLIIN